MELKVLVVRVYLAITAKLVPTE